MLKSSLAGITCAVSRCTLCSLPFTSACVCHARSTRLPTPCMDKKLCTRFEAFSEMRLFYLVLRAWRVSLDHVSVPRDVELAAASSPGAVRSVCRRGGMRGMSWRGKRSPAQGCVGGELLSVVRPKREASSLALSCSGTPTSP